VAPKQEATLRGILAEGEEGEKEGVQASCHLTSIAHASNIHLLLLLSKPTLG